MTPEEAGTEVARDRDPVRPLAADPTLTETPTAPSGTSAVVALAPSTGVVIASAHLVHSAVEPAEVPAPATPPLLAANA